MVTDLVTKNQGLAFSERLANRARERRTWLCVGLDPDVDRLPAHLPSSAAGIVEFCGALIEATAAHAAAFKINFAFFEALGREGWAALSTVRDAIPRDIPVIADAKRGDIPSTSRAYAQAIFERLDFDAVTANPFVGWDGLEPFLAYPERCVFVLCRTSNPGAGELQDVDVAGAPLYLHVARRATSLRGPAEVGLVVGATHPAALTAGRALSEALLLLLPGIGAQGAGAREAISSGGNIAGENALVNVSRQIIYASAGDDFAAQAAAAAHRYAEETWISNNASGG